jgi:hypothetical protein
MMFLELTKFDAELSFPQIYPDPLCGPLAMTMASKIVCK